MVVSGSLRGGKGERALAGHDHGQAVGGRGGPELASRSRRHRDHLAAPAGPGSRSRRSRRPRRVSGGAVLSVVPSMVRRTVWKVRVGKVRVWPAGRVRGLGRSKVTGSLPSKVTVTLDTQRARSPRLGLDQGDVVGGHRVGELLLPPLAGRVGHEGAGDPGRVEVVVDGAVGLVLGRVGDRVAVAAGRDVDRADVGGVVLVVDARAREELDRAVARVGLGRVLARRLGGPALAVRVSQRKACLRLVSVTTSWAPWAARLCSRAGCVASVPA